MAFHLTNLPTHRLFSLVFFFLLATNINSAQPLSFNFNKLTNGNPELILQGDAHFVDGGFVALTNRKPPATTTGRALYKTPVTLWNDTTGQVASFNTSFSFVVESPEEQHCPTDGLIFFIAPLDTVIPNNSDSRYLGVVDGKNAINRFVGLEFDLYPNYFDPYMRHIGIDVNSLISLKTEKWNWVSDSLTKVTITYDSPSNELSALVTYENGEYTSIAQAVDLKTVLPNIVKIGFSATSKTGVAHNIHSWSFASDLETTISSVSDI
ncbi:non-seed lectin-like [Vicia villosa]|uniref:non-seed lectin-like n=1 Tax=Vicia villosa TaxID=3911 RepID=UPI00273C18B8|nr:non-seed lectin-like [Vicia villosa]